MTCKARVWDNGDMTDCGKESHRPHSQYCGVHYDMRWAALVMAIAQHENTLVVLKALQDDLRRT